MRTDKVKSICIVFIGALIGIVVALVIMDLLNASRLSTTSLKHLDDYLGAGIVIYLLGKALGCWHKYSWVFMALIACLIIIDINHFISTEFWFNINNAQLSTIIAWFACFSGGILIGRFVHIRVGRQTI